MYNVCLCSCYMCVSCVHVTYLCLCSCCNQGQGFVNLRELGVRQLPCVYLQLHVYLLHTCADVMLEPVFHPCASCSYVAMQIQGVCVHVTYVAVLLHTFMLQLDLGARGFMNQGWMCVYVCLCYIRVHVFMLHTCACVHVAIRVRGSSTFVSQGFVNFGEVPAAACVSASKNLADKSRLEPVFSPYCLCVCSCYIRVLVFMLYVCFCVHVTYVACVHVAIRFRGSSTFMNQGWDVACTCACVTYVCMCSCYIRVLVFMLQLGLGVRQPS